MYRIALRLFVLLVILAGVPLKAAAAPILVDFEGLEDYTNVGSSLTGLSFTNATVLTAGTSLNDYDFPPRSGTNIVYDDGGAMNIAFSAPVYEVSGFITYLAPVTLSAYRADGELLGRVTSALLQNYVSAGGGANEFLGFTSDIGISYITLAGHAFGGSFVLDDFSYETVAPAAPPVPEPASMSLLLLGGAAILARRRARPVTRTTT